LKIELLDLEFNGQHFYIQKESVVEKVTFNNRTFYSKFEKHQLPINRQLLQQHQNHETILAISLIEENRSNYIVIEYQQEDWQIFYALVKHLLKSLNIVNFQAYFNPHKKLFQLFIPREKTELESIYREVENIKHLLELKSKKSYKIYPNKNLPKNFNIITLPTKKI
jgi:hypothetical protein